MGTRATNRLVLLDRAEPAGNAPVSEAGTEFASYAGWVTRFRFIDISGISIMSSGGAKKLTVPRRTLRMHGGLRFLAS